MAVTQLATGDCALLLKILESASQAMSAAGCNDTDPEWLADYTDPQLAEVHAAICEKGEEPNTRECPAPDFCYLDYLRTKIEAMFQEAE